MRYGSTGCRSLKTNFIFRRLKIDLAVSYVPKHSGDLHMFRGLKKASTRTTADSCIQISPEGLVIANAGRRGKGATIQEREELHRSSLIEL
mmetsp:Transcript_33151/g.80553  ORF Transcript_33151/g.80553 Transcript_33151/m.80553 type:complete len:91 (-) Transcript_33151:107-379(-)